MESIIKQISECSLLSIDIFDTLLFRLTHRPDDVFAKVGQRILELDSAWVGFNHDCFRELRMKAQREAREKALKERRCAEVSIEEIYIAMGALEKAAQICVGIELDEEKKICCANSEVLDYMRLARAKGLIVVLATDMYFSSDQIVELLEACGVERSLYDGVFVSCECGGNKESGELFQRVISAYPSVAQSGILHIGDRLDADFDAAKRLGLQAALYGSVAHFLSEVFEYERLQCGAPMAELAFLRKGSSIVEGAFFERFGAAILGPPVVVFCEWVLDRCEAEGVELLCPLMREAEVFAPVLEEANQRRGGVVRIEPLFVSRSSTWLAALERWDEAAAEELMDRTGMCVADVLLYLNVESPDGFSGELQRSELRGESNTWVREKLKAYLLRSDIRNRVNALILKRRTGLLAYLSRTLAGVEHAATVDLGFRGTIPSCLDRVLKQEGPAVKLQHWLMLGTRELSVSRADGSKISGFLSEPGRCEEVGTGLRRTSFFLEQLLTGASGSVEGFTECDDLWVPVLGEPIRDRFTLQAKAASLAGVLEFQRRFHCSSALARGRFYFGLERCNELGSILSRAVEWPTTEEAQHLGRLLHDFNGGALAERRVCSDLDRRVLDESGDVETFLRVGRSLGLHWPEGVVAARSGDDLMRLAAKEAKVSDSYFAPMYSLAEQARAAGYIEVILYGAGDAGRTLAKAAKVAGLRPLCIVDRKEALWGMRIEGVEVMSLAAALTVGGDPAFLVGSFAFPAEIKRAILEARAGAKVFLAKNLMEKEKAVE